MGRHRLAGALLAILLAAGCGQAGDGGDTSSQAVRQRGELDPAVTARLDSGTMAYREDEYREARRHYRRAAELAPDLASAWFGVMLAERALGNDEVADSIEARLDGAIPTDPHGAGTHGGDTVSSGAGEGGP